MDLCRDKYYVSNIFYEHKDIFINNIIKKWFDRILVLFCLFEFWYYVIILKLYYTMLYMGIKEITYITTLIYFIYIRIEVVI